MAVSSTSARYTKAMISHVTLQFVGVLNSVAIFPADRDIFFHEVRSSAGYSVATFVVAFTLVEIPLELLGVIVRDSP